MRQAATRGPGSPRLPQSRWEEMELTEGRSQVRVPHRERELVQELAIPDQSESVGEPQVA